MSKYINADEFIQEYNKIDLKPYINKGYAQLIDGYEMWEKWKIEFDQNVRQIVARLLTEREDEDKFIARIKDIPIMPMLSADVVEVIHCKDCKHYTEYMAYTKSFKSHYCSGGFVDSNMALHPDDFCSYGERKETDDRPHKTND